MTHGNRLPLLALGSLIAGSLALAPTTAQAERKSTLDGVPAVRHRLLLVKKRFEATILSEASINTDFRHTLGAGAKLEYHMSDMISFGAVGVFGVGLSTGLTDRIVSSLPDASAAGDPTPTKEQFSKHLNDIPIHGAAYVSVTPWYGKLAAFGKFFVNFDFYFQGGLAYAQLKTDCNEGSCWSDRNAGVLDPERNLVPDNIPNNDPALNDGSRLGLYFGGGIHVFMNDWIALDFTVRDYLFSDNPSGLDFDADLIVSDDDNRFLNHLFMGVGVSFLFPTDVERTP